MVSQSHKTEISEIIGLIDQLFERGQFTLVAIEPKDARQSYWMFCVAASNLGISKVMPVISGIARNKPQATCKF